MKKKTKSFRSLVKEEYQSFDNTYYNIKYYGKFAVAVHEMDDGDQETWFDFHHPEWIKKGFYISSGCEFDNLKPIRALWYEKNEDGTLTDYKFFMEYTEKLDLQPLYNQLLASPINWTEYLFSDRDVVRLFAARMLNE